MKARQGMAELGKPGYDKRLWDDRDSWLKAPTLREVTEIALEVVGSATGQQWWLGYVDDALFAGMDLGGGYKTVEQIGNELGKKALTQAVNMGVGSVTKWAGNAAGTALSKSGKAANIFAQAGISAAGSYAGSVANNYVNALDLSKLGTKEWMNWEAGNAGWTSAGSVSGALSAGIRSGMGSAFGTMGAATNKFYGGAMSLATSAATQAATYGTYLAFNGGNFGAAYEAMGGITLNVANLGAMADMAGTGIARTNSTGQSRLGSIAQALSGTGLLEVNFGSSGITGRIGMGGIDVGGNLYNLAKRMTDKASLEAYKAEYGDDKGNTAYNAYVYGDWTAENTAARLGSGKDELLFIDGKDKEKEWNAQTIQNGKGGRTIEMKDGASAINNAITLQHEAYRDGIVGNNQRDETLQAVLAHTVMAARLHAQGIEFSTSGQLGYDMAVYEYAVSQGDMSIFTAYTDGNYDSSADYWKVLSDGNIVFDGSKNLYDENGILLKEYQGTEGFTDSLAAMLGVSFEDANKLMIDADYRWDGEKKEFVNKDGKSANLNESMKIITSGSFKASYDFQINYADQVFEKFDGSMVSAVNAYKNDINQRLELERVAGSINAKTMAGYEMLSGLSAFATQYDTTVYGTGETIIPYKTDNGLYNRNVDLAYNENKVLTVLKEISQNQTRSDNHPMYKNILNETISPLLGPDGNPSPMVGENRLSDDPIYFTTRTKYAGGKEHGWSRDGAFAMSVDLGTRDVPLEAATFTNATVFAQSSPFGWRDDSGGFAQMNVGPLDLRYVHLDNSWQLQRLMNLNQSAVLNNLYRYSLPPGLSFGPLYYGELPSSSGTHLHMEFIWR